MTACLAPAWRGPPRPRAIERPAEVHVHHHWHGVTAEEIAAIIETSRREQP